MLVATPNPAAWQFRVLGSRWPHVDAPPRIWWLIPLDVLRRHLDFLGLALVAVQRATTRVAGAGTGFSGWSQAVLNPQVRLR